MSALGVILDDLTNKARANWDSLPLAGYGEFSYSFPVIREIIPGASEQKNIDTGDISQLPLVVETAKKLEKRGDK